MALNETNIPVPRVDGGLNTSVSSLTLPSTQSPKCENVIIDDGLIRSRTGFIKRDGDDGDPNENTWESAGTQPDIIYKFHQHENFDTTARDYFWCFGREDTQLVGHRWDEGNDRWQNEFSQGSWLSATDEYSVYVSKITDSDSDEWMVVTFGDKASGGLGSTPPPIYYSQGTDTTYVGGATKTTGTRYKYIIAAFGKLLGFNGGGGGTGSDNAPTRITWSANWWADGVQLTNSHPALNHNTAFWNKADSQSGYAYLDDTEGAINGATLLRNTVVCFKEDSIWVGNELSQSPYIRWQKLSSNIGLLSPGMFETYNDVLYFVGNDNIYAYSGGNALTPIGNAIWTTFKSDLGHYDKSSADSSIHTSFTLVDRTRGNIYFWIPTRGDEFALGGGVAPYPNKAYVYNVRSNAWTTVTAPYSDSIKARVFTGGGTREEGNLETLELQDSSYPYLASVVVSNLNPFTYTAGEVLIQSNQVYHDTSEDDDDKAIFSYWQSKDFAVSLAESTVWQRVYSTMQVPAEATADGSVSVGLALDGTEIDGSDGVIVSTKVSLDTDESNDLYKIKITNWNRQAKTVRLQYYAERINTGFILHGFELVTGVNERSST